jgi:hypothetical protein
VTMDWNHEPKYTFFFFVSWLHQSWFYFTVMERWLTHSSFKEFYFPK